MDTRSPGISVLTGGRRSWPPLAPEEHRAVQNGMIPPAAMVGAGLQQKSTRTWAARAAGPLPTSRLHHEGVTRCFMP